MEKTNRPKRIISKLLIIVFLFFSFSILVESFSKDAYAAILVQDETVLGGVEGNTAGDDAAFSWEKAWEKLKENSKEIAGAAFKKAVSSFLKQIAYDTATYLATGDEGQKPMFYTEGWGKYLENVADNAAGTFLEELGKNPYLQFNLCEPDFNVQVKIGLGLQSQFKPKKPACTFSEMKKNWEEELDNPNFLNRFGNMFDSNSNDFSIALKVRSGMENKISKEVNDAINDRTEGEGFKAVTENISGYIKSPAKSVVEAHGQLYTDATKKELTWTGTAADAIDVFINTLVSKLIDKFLKDGLVSKFDDNSYKGDYGNFSDADSSPYASGIKGAKDRFRSIIEPEFGVRGDYNIIGELTSCPNPSKAGPTSCVITDRFAEAVSNKMTVGKAMKEGYLNPAGIFGFTADGLEPFFKEGYPYRSIVILRKFRILPVGWEIAAQYIKDRPWEEALGGTGGTKNLEDLVNCFTDDDEYGVPADTLSWCRGLVDPNWVLKAPMNFCKREGPGPELLSENVVGEGENSKLLISRNDNYCADEQTCIKEDSDGSCMLYGYCSEERRKWNYGSESCYPENNTCNTFRSRDGDTVSYLENTLDFGTCSINNVGCKNYCEDFDFAADEYTCTPTTGDKLFVDKDVEVCDTSVEGCHEFIRTKGGTGSNLLKNSSFEVIGPTDFVGDTLPDTFDYWGAVGSAMNDSFVGFSSLLLSAPLSHILTIDPAGYDVSLEDYTFSFYAKECGTAATYTLGANTQNMGTFSTSGWRYFSVTYAYPITPDNQVSFSITPDGTDCKIDAIKLERGSKGTAYAEYRGRGLIYQNLAPDYLNCDGVADPVECDDFVRFCDVSEVGCDLYTSASDGMSIPGKVAPVDQCPGECVGYDMYLQSNTYFDSPRPENFIPNTAQACSAETNGCDEFTNLDRLGEGAEAREYYSQLRQCVRPNDPTSNCGEFYTWEGSADTGYQLRVFTLEIDNDGDDGSLPLFAQYTQDPAVTSPDHTECDATIYGYLPSNPLYNSDCREFYNTSGEISYHLYNFTISCSENCHPYRRTEVNIDPSTGLPDCKNGGVWNVEHGACIYMAIPGEGKKCSSAQAGCREYSGNTGNNIRLLFTNDFEGSTQGWYGLGGSTLSLSSNSLIAGGESLEVTGGAYSIAFDMGDLVREGNSYILQFLAEAPVNLTASIENATSTANFSGTASVNAGQWDVYELNLAILDHTVYTDERLVITATGNFNIDDVRLIEVTDRYYLIKNSWETPASCNDDIFGNFQGPNFNLGCDEYFDRYGDIFYLHDFTSLCAESAVGCELMIDTYNYSDYNGMTFHPGDDSEEIVPADSYAYVVYDQDKICNREDKGCQRVGETYQYGNDYTFGDEYLKNDPDLYDRTLCMGDEVACEEWSFYGGSTYFKDPANMTCDYRQKQGVGDNWGWYKRKVKRCDDIIEVATGLPNGLINTGVDGLGNLIPLETTLCKKDSDCATGIKCIMDENDYPCSVAQSPAKTIGYGGVGNLVYQPTRDSDGNNWVGVCPASQSTCSEFIDPVSEFSPNLIFNPNYSDIDGDTLLGDGWTAVGPAWTQEIFDVEPYTLYKFGGKNNTGATLTITCDYSISILDGNNDISGLPAPSNTLSITLGPDPMNRLIYSNNNTNCVVRTSNLAGSIELRQAVIAYQLERDADTETCNGQVDFDEGCVLFNQRGVTGGIGGVYDYSPLSYDAAATVNNSLANSLCTGNDCDSNVLLKVSPDRDCSEWLACRSMVEDERGDNVCLDIGLCNNVDQNGVCKQFVVTASSSAREISVPGADVSSIANSTGYSKVGLYGVSDDSMRGEYPFGVMDQVGNTLLVTNGNFEIIGDNKYPIGWLMEAADRAWEDTYFSIIDNPVEAQKAGVGSIPEGRAFLKAGEYTDVVSDYIDLSAGLSYILSAKINTIALNGGQARVSVVMYNTNNAAVGTPAELTLDSGRDWEFLQIRFTGFTSATKARVRLSTGGTGNYYVDDIKIKPALEIRSDDYVPQTCRLYPSDDSLSCDYMEDSGLRKKGWWGYCLEYDRYPGNEDACLQWWPVDRVAGNGIGNQGMFSGYSGKYPVFYCDHIDAEFEFIEHRQERLLRYEEESGWGILSVVLTAGIILLFDAGSSSDGGANVCPAVDQGITNGGYYIRTRVEEDDGLFSSSVEVWTYCTPLPGDRITGQWYRYNGNLVKFNGLDYGGWDETVDGVKIYDPTNSGGPIDPKDYNIKCKQIWETVNSIGGNKAWLDRVHEATSYKTHMLDYGYEEDDPPFGSVVPPEPVNNPYEWDGSTLRGIQPLYYLEESDGLARAGSPYECYGNQCANMGRCDISGDVCLYVPINRPTGVINYCPINSTNPCYENWEQTFLACPTGERCLRNLNNLNLVAPPANPDSNLQRIFAKSYGRWEWQGNTGYCAGGINDGDPCNYNGNQCSGGTCRSRCQMNLHADGNIREVVNVDPSTGALIDRPFCTADADCAGIVYNTQTAATLSAANTCQAATTVCGAGGSTCITSQCDPSVLTPAEMTDCTTYFSNLVTIPGHMMCSQSLNECDPGSSTGLNECDYISTCEYDTCVGGTNDGVSCTAEHTCTDSYCVLESTAAGRYMPIQGGWDVPTRLCLDNDGDGDPGPRSIWQESDHQCYSLAAGTSGSCFDCAPFTEFCDYCAVTPEIYNLKIDGNTGNPASPNPNVEFAENKLVNFSFNSYVDPNQMPLVGLYVNWGDGEATVVTGVEMYNKPNPEAPHSWYHIYDYWELRTKFVQGYAPDIVCAAAGNPLPGTGLTCDLGANCCAVQPKVKIKDNWGYCNNGCDSNGDGIGEMDACLVGPCPAGGYVEWGDDWGSEPYIVVHER